MQLYYYSLISYKCVYITEYICKKGITSSFFIFTIQQILPSYYWEKVSALVVVSKVLLLLLLSGLLSQSVFNLLLWCHIPFSEKGLYPILLHSWHSEGCQVRDILLPFHCFGFSRVAHRRGPFFVFCLLKPL